jgi:hypothetical protein
MNSLVQTLQRHPPQKCMDAGALQSSLELFAAFTQTGNEEYRHLSNRFLGFALAGE